MEGSHLLGLPTELQIVIFAELPVKQIALLRSVCKSIKNVVENQRNQFHLLKQKINPVMKALDDTVKRVLNYDADTDFTVALREYVLHRGITVMTPEFTFGSGSFTSIGNLKAFAETWTRRKAKHLDLSPQKQLEVRACSKLLAASLLKQHILWHETGIKVDTEVEMERAVFERHLYIAVRLGYDEAWVRSVLRSIRRDGIFKGSLVNVNKIAKPEFALTCISSPLNVAGNFSDESAAEDFFISTKDLAEMVGVPQIEDDGCFAFCVKTKSTMELVKKGMVGTCPFKKAAVVEELELH